MVYSAFLRSMGELSAIPDNGRIRIALSGGIDSTALLLLLQRFVEDRRPDIELSIGHVNHGLRATADADEDHCRQFAERAGIPFVVERTNVQALADETKSSLETAGRRARLSAFQRWTLRQGVWAVATGHHRDDQAETILGNLLRGTGFDGLRGMPIESTIEGARVIRPLLSLDRRKLASFVESAGVEIREDETNDDPRFRRNRIRHVLLPKLEQFNPGIRKALLGLRDDAESYLEMRDQLLPQQLDQLGWGPDIVRFRRPLLVALPDPLVHGVLDAAWRKLSGQPTGLDRSHHTAWRELVDGNEGSSHDLPGGWLLQRASDHLWLLREADDREPPAAPAVDRRHVPWLGAHFRVGTGTTELPRTWLADAMLRCVQPGDRLPIDVHGKDAHADINEMLRAHGVPAALRTRYPVLEHAGIPVWVPGCRRAHAEEEVIEAGSVAVDLEFDAGITPVGFVVRELTGSFRN